MHALLNALDFTASKCKEDKSSRISIATAGVDDIAPVIPKQVNRCALLSLFLQYCTGALGHHTTASYTIMGITMP